MTHLLMGAINKLTNNYEYPRIAEKINKYMCPDCNKDVILKKGSIRIHHFAHYKSENPCKYYEHPGESQIHKDAKMAFKTILDKEIKINLLRKCNYCKNNCKHIIEKKTDNSIIQLEYGFIFNDSHKKADIAYLEGDTLKYIFEICYKHKTIATNRPEPWFEINAEKILEDINKSEYLDNTIQLECIRNEKCNDCIVKDNEEKEKRRLREIELAERDRLYEIEKIKSVEIRKIVWAGYKKCSKCSTPYDKCKRCVNKLWKKHKTMLKEYMNSQQNTINVI